MASQAKRILYVEANEDHTVGGSHQALYDLVRGLDRSRFEPIVLFYQENDFAARLRGVCEVVAYERERAAERAVYETGSRPRRLLEMVRAIVRRRRFLRDHRIDLVHINNSPRVGNDDWLPAARLLGVKCIANVMGDAAGESGRIRRYLFQAFDHVLPISGYMTAAMKNAGIAPDRMTQVYLGVDAEAVRQKVKRTAAQVRAELGVGDDVMLCAMVGNIREWKGQHVVLDALARLSEAERSRLCVAFIGATAPAFAAYEKRLRQIVDERGLSGSVRFVGGRSDVPDFFSAADVALHASIRPEPFGLVVVEAMAVGTPVVAANTGGPAEVVSAASGLTFDPGKPDELAEILRGLAAAPDRRAALGRGAMQRADDFSIRAYVQGIEAVYDRIVHGTESADRPASDRPIHSAAPASSQAGAGHV